MHVSVALLQGRLRDPHVPCLYEAEKPSCTVATLIVFKGGLDKSLQGDDSTDGTIEPARDTSAAGTLRVNS